MPIDVNPFNGICIHLPIAKNPGRPELLRCSIIESLRSAAPDSPSSTLVCSASCTELKWTRDLGRDIVTLNQKEFEALSKEREELFVKHYDNMVFERSVDQIGFSNNPVDQEAVFGNLLSSYNGSQKSHPLFTLPVSIRRRIYDFCFPQEPRKISLSPYFATKRIFAKADFASPWDVLEPTMGGLEAFRELRHELMTYFWTQYHFHVTLSPFTGPKFSPLSSVWLLEYLEIVQFLTVEVDFTRFGFGAPSYFAVKKIGFCALSKGCAEYGQNFEKKIENLLIEIVQGLVKRRGKTTMAEFNLMCRRYADARPVDSSKETVCDSKSIPYFSDNSLFLSDVVSDLRGILQMSRVSGFTSAYTETIIRTIFTDSDNEPNWNLALGGDCAWPPLPINTDDTFEVGRINQAMLSLLDASPFEPLPLTTTSSFEEEIENELRKYESPVYSEKALTEESALSGEYKSESTKMPSDAAEKYQEFVGLINSPSSSNQATYPLQNSDPTSGNLLLPVPSITTSRSANPKSHQSTQWSQTRLSNDGRCHLLAETPTDGSRCSTPKSPNAMNRRNEQDPAFLRTVDALRSLDDDDKAGAAKTTRRKTMIPSPVRKREEVEGGDGSQKSQGTKTQPAGTVRRYLSFMKRLRVPGV